MKTTLSWKISGGSDVGFTLDWGDGNTTLLPSIYRANETQPLSLNGTHTYSTEGKYKMFLTAKNNISNETLEIEVFIQKSLDEVVLEAPKVLQPSDNGSFKLSYLSIKPLNVSWDFGNGNVFRNLTTTLMSFCYFSTGTYTVTVKAFNLVSKITLSKIVFVQNSIRLFQFTKNEYFGEVGAPLSLSILQNGTNTSVLVDFKDGAVAQIGSDINNQSIRFTHKFDVPGIYHIMAVGSNLISMQNATTLVIVEDRITGLVASVVCSGNTIYCFEKDPVEITVSTRTGSNINYIYDFGDGRHFNSTLAKTKSTYEHHGNYTGKVIAYNNVSSETVSLTTISVKKLVPLELLIACNKSVHLTNLTTCQLYILNGNGYTCTVNMGDGKGFEFKYPDTLSVVQHKYNERGSFSVQFSCNNNHGAKTEVYKTQVGSVLGLKTTHISRAIAKEPLTFVLEMEFRGGVETCFIMDYGDGNKVGYYADNASCEVKYIGVSFSALPSDFTVSANHSYLSAGIYNISWAASNLVSNESVESSLVVTEGLCLIPQIEFINLNAGGRYPFEILRSEKYAIRSKITVDCNEALGSVVSWSIEKKVSPNEYIEVKNAVTVLPELVIEPLSLSYGFFRVTCSFKLLGVPRTLNSSEENIKIVPSPLKAKILHGPLLRIPFKSEVTLDGTDSHDPDEPTDGTNGIEFSWYCAVPSESEINTIKTFPVSSLEETYIKNSKYNCFENTSADTKPVSSGSTFVLPSLYFKINMTLLIKLTVRKEERRTSSIAVLQIASEHTPILTIR